MFKKGMFIVYGTRGVCEIVDITHADMEGLPGDRWYYYLHPCYEKECKILTPVDGNKTAMREILTKEEAQLLIEDILTIEEMWVEDSKQREAQYKEALRGGDCRRLIGIIKTLYLQKQYRMAQGKKTLSLDEKYLKMAEDNLYAELSISLEMSREHMIEYVSERIQQSNRV